MIRFDYRPIKFVSESPASPGEKMLSVYTHTNLVGNVETSEPNLGTFRRELGNGCT